MENVVFESNALQLPIYNKLRSKIIVLASSSPRRLQILRQIGISPQVVPSIFSEDLDHADFEDTDAPQTKALRYTVATATEKAVEVYTRLVESTPEAGPDLVIGADTVIQTFLPGSGLAAKILEKPKSKADQLSKLEDLVHSAPETKIEAVTGVAIVYPIISSPGYAVATFGESTRIWFGDLDTDTLKAYVLHGQGIDRAGGFSVEGVGSQLIRRIDGDWNNALGFPAYAFAKFIKGLMQTEEEFLAD